MKNPKKLVWLTIALALITIAAILVVKRFRDKKERSDGIVVIDESLGRRIDSTGRQDTVKLVRNPVLSHDQLIATIKHNYSAIENLTIECNKTDCDMRGTFTTESVAKKDQFTRMVNGGLGRLIIEGGYKPAADLKISAVDESAAQFSMQIYNEDAL